jgi:hypothetical protein
MSPLFLGLKNKPSEKPELCLLPASCWFIAYLIFLPWRWRQHIPPKCQLSFNELHSIISQDSTLTANTVRICIKWAQTTLRNYIGFPPWYSWSLWSFWPVSCLHAQGQSWPSSYLDTNSSNFILLVFIKGQLFQNSCPQWKNSEPWLSSCLKIMKDMYNWEITIICIFIFKLNVRMIDRPSDRRLSEKLVPTFADRGCRVVSAMDSYGR